MASGKLSPRQKMINMMYLVLMALLALNVSKEILKSFHLMEVSFNKAKKNVDDKIDAQMKSFAKQAENDPSLMPYYKRAQQAHTWTTDFVSYIEGIKVDLENRTEGRKWEDGQDTSVHYMAELASNDNIEKHANYFLVDATGGDKPGWRSEKLENEINTLRSNLLSLLKSDTANGIDFDAQKVADVVKSSQLNTDYDTTKRYKSWTEQYIEHSPLAAVITLLTKVQNDAVNSESAVLNLLQQGKETEVVIDEIFAMVRPLNGTVIMSGGKYEAEVFISAKTRGEGNVEVKLGKGGGSLEQRDGKWIYTATGGGAGSFPFEGVIEVKTPKETKTLPFKEEFHVFAGNATVSASSMNVFYIGVDNPVSITAPGDPKDINASLSGAGSLSRSGSGWVAKVNQRGKCQISVSTKLSDGSVKQVASQEFRILPLPKPIAKWGAIESGATAPVNALTVQRQIEASMGDGFVFEGVRYQVVSYQFVYAPRRGEAYINRANGAAISPEFKGVIQKNARPGDRIIVDQIRATGPDGTKTLAPISITIQ